MNPIESTDSDRYPTLTDDGRRILQRMREHPHAPIFRNESGNRLTRSDLDRVRAHEKKTLSETVSFARNRHPEWLDAFVGDCIRDVPHFRNRGPRPLHFLDLPTTDRGDVGRDITEFVPDSVPTERMINFRTSGTTGHPLLIASHPVVAASYLAYHLRALQRFGLELRHGRNEVGVILLGYQRVCFTYVSVTPTRDDTGLAKINLHPNDWRDPSDRTAYLDAMNPEVLAGDPLSFSILLDLPVICRPRALFCTSMTLLPGLRDRLQTRFGCPVLDFYSMNEAGPIAVADPQVGGHVLLQPRMHVEILDTGGNPVPPGQRGEVTLTGGFNFCLPLLRYRTGDYAELRDIAGEPVLIDLEGRPPVRFRTMAGEWLNNIEITHALRPYAISRFVLHQEATGAIRFSYEGNRSEETTLHTTLIKLFGPTQTLVFTPMLREPAKQVQYTSDLSGACP